MANKPQGKNSTMGLFAFIAICFNALAWIIDLIFNAFKIDEKIAGMSLNGLFTAIASLILTILVLYIAYGYAKKLSKNWRIVYWVIAIVSILAILFGVGFNFAN